MVIAYEEAVRRLTAPGARFELASESSDDIFSRGYRHAPATLRNVFDDAPPVTGAALVYQDERFDLDTLKSTVLRLAAAMTARGVRKGDRVAIAMRNLPEYVFVFWASQYIGAVLVGLNAWWVGAELAFGLMDCQPKVVFVDGERLGRLDDQTRQRLSCIVVTRAIGRVNDSRVQAWSDYMADGDLPPPRPELKPGDAATMLYTSGTTGRPKGAVSTHRNHAMNLMNLAFYGAVGRLMRDASTDIDPPATRAAALLPFPMFHIGGLSALYVGMAFGSRAVLLRKWDAQEAARLIEVEQITSVALAPSMLKQLIELPVSDSIDWASLNGFATGSAPVSADLLRQAERRFGGAALPAVGYGLTEATSGVCASAGAMLKAKPGSVGPVFPTLDIRIVDPDTLQNLETGEAGEIWLRGSNVIAGYWNQPEASTASFVKEGWFRTGDIGRLDDDGFLFIVDRLKDVIIRGGENVYCVEVEDVLLAHSGVYEAAVFGVPDALLGETVAAVVIAVPGSALTEADLITFARERLAYFKVPARVTLRDVVLPRTPTGKVDKKVLRVELTAR